MFLLVKLSHNNFRFYPLFQWVARADALVQPVQAFPNNFLHWFHRVDQKFSARVRAIFRGPKMTFLLSCKQLAMINCQYLSQARGGFFLPFKRLTLFCHISGHQNCRKSDWRVKIFTSLRMKPNRQFLDRFRRLWH